MRIIGYRATPGRKTDLMRRNTSRLAPGYHSQDLFGRCAVFKALKHGLQPQPGAGEHRFSSKNLAIPCHEAFEPLFHRCHILIFILGSCFVQNALAGQIVQKPLDEFVIYKIPVAFQSGNTTILFPSAISGLYAKSVAVQEQAQRGFPPLVHPGKLLLHGPRT